MSASVTPVKLSPASVVAPINAPARKRPPAAPVTATRGIERESNDCLRPAIARLVEKVTPIAKPQNVPAAIPKNGSLESRRPKTAATAVSTAKKPPPIAANVTPMLSMLRTTRARRDTELTPLEPTRCTARECTLHARVNRRCRAVGPVDAERRTAIFPT